MDKFIPDMYQKSIFSIDFKVIILSNATKKRLTPFKEILNVDVAYSSRKPLKKKYLKIMRLYNLKPGEVACIGDQIMTDILGANRAECLSILVNSIGTKEPIWTRFNRFFEKFILKNLAKKAILEKGKYYE